ncbi:MAG: hypothetical protein MSG64_03780 [Pyrinomonadaceae bacterium MAG19_C2-C3]|nr:hypothetical protein [Pyrinomonadaceae bacterium MAG19_C2-C3]
MKSLIALLLTWCLFVASSPVAFAQQGGTSAAQKSIAKIKQKVEKIGYNNNVTVKLANGAYIHGTIKNIESDRFFVAEVDRVNIAEINYGDATKIQKGYGNVNRITGKRNNARTQRILGIVGVAVLATLLIAPIVALGTQEGG